MPRWELSISSEGRTLWSTGSDRSFGSSRFGDVPTFDVRTMSRAEQAKEQEPSVTAGSYVPPPTIPSSSSVRERAEAISESVVGSAVDAVNTVAETFAPSDPASATILGEMYDGCKTGALAVGVPAMIRGAYKGATTGGIAGAPAGPAGVAAGATVGAVVDGGIGAVGGCIAYGAYKGEIAKREIQETGPPEPKPYVSDLTRKVVVDMGADVVEPVISAYRSVDEALSRPEARTLMEQQVYGAAHGAVCVAAVGNPMATLLCDALGTGTDTHSSDSSSHEDLLPEG